MLTVDLARFDPQGRVLVTITKHRVAGHKLERLDNKLIATSVWDHKLTHASNIVIGDDVVVATNTSGHHLGIGALSGELLWERPPPSRHAQHEGHAGIILCTEGVSCFVFASWFGLLTQMRLDTGENLTSGWSTGLRQPRLFKLADGRLAAVAARTPVGDTDQSTTYLAEIDLARRSTAVLSEYGPVRDVHPDPAGKRSLLVEMYAPPGTEDVPVRERREHWLHRLRIIDLLSGESLAVRDIRFGMFATYGAHWSPNGSLLGVGSKEAGIRGAKSHVILDASDLRTVAEMPHSDPRGAPAFHPDGEHVLLPRGKKSLLTRLDDLLVNAPEP